MVGTGVVLRRRGCCGRTSAVASDHTFLDPGGRLLLARVTTLRGMAASTSPLWPRHHCVARIARHTVRCQGSCQRRHDIRLRAILVERPTESNSQPRSGDRPGVVCYVRTESTDGEISRPPTYPQPCYASGLTRVDGPRSLTEHKGNMSIPESMPAVPVRSSEIADLRAQIGAVVEQGTDHGVLAFGVDAVDNRLASGGLTVGGLHEFAGASTSLADDAATTLFIAGIAAQFAAGSSGPALWATTRFDLYAPGLEQAGLQPAQALFAEAKDDATLLALLEDAVRDGSPAAVIGEIRRASMVATRRLQLAAADSGVPVLLFRRWRKLSAEPFDEPSAAATRWRIGCAPSAPLRIAGVGRPRWTVDVVRQRGGEPFSLLVEGCDASGRLAVPAPARRRAAASAGTAQHLAA